MTRHKLAIFFGLAACGILAGYFAETKFAPSRLAYGTYGMPKGRNTTIATASIDKAQTAGKNVPEKRLKTKDSEIILGILRTLLSDKRNGHEIYELFEALGSLDHASAMSAAAELAGEGFPRSALFVVMGWAQSDPKGACQWANSQRDAAYLNYALDGMMKTGSYSTAAACAMGLSEGLGKYIFTTRLAENWAKVSEEDVLSWLATFPPEEAELRNQAIGALLGTMAASDSKSIAALTWNTMAPGPARATALGSVVKKWLQQGGSVDDVRQWLATLPMSADQGPALTQIALQYSTSDPKKAVDLVGSMPSGSDQNQAVLFVAAKIPSDDIQLRFSLTEKITGPQRMSALEASITNWAKAEPDAAIGYVQDDPLLSTAEKQALVETIANTRK